LYNVQLEQNYAPALGLWHRKKTWK